MRDLSRSLPILREEDDVSFLYMMLSELNSKFTLRLDSYPITDQSSQVATEYPEENST
jgi:hypothetical protein